MLLAQHQILNFKRHLERNRPTSAHQISLQTSLIADSINRFALPSLLGEVLRQGQGRASRRQPPAGNSAARSRIGRP